MGVAALCTQKSSHPRDVTNSGMMSQFLFPSGRVGVLVIFCVSLSLTSCHYCHMEKTRMIFALYSRDDGKNVTWLCCKKKLKSHHCV
jgi:hypothetical protein